MGDLLPFELVDKSPKSDEARRRQSRDRVAWFEARGLDPGNWSRVVYPALLRAWAAYGIPSAFDRSREMKSRPET